MATGSKDASKSGKLLSNPKTPKTVQSVAGSDLAQTPKKTPPPKKAAPAKKTPPPKKKGK
jgi:hypothetical protein